MSIVKQKTDQVVDILNELGIDLWLTYVRKTSEIHDPCLYFLTEDSWLTWQTMFLISKDGRKTVICGRYDVPNIEMIGIYDEIISFDESLQPDLVRVLDEIDPSSIAINYSEDNVAADGLTHGLWLRLNKFLENTPYRDRLRSSDNLLAALRGRKTSLELDKIRKAVDISERGHKHLAKSVKLGMTEQDLESILLKFTEENNVTVSYQPLINVGSETTIGHGKATSDVIVKQGDLINIDYGVFYDRYASDIQRVHYVLKENEDSPPKEVERAFDVVIKAISTGAEKLKPGLKGWEVDYVSRKIITNAGYPEFKHALGHQIGLNVHDGGCLLGPKWEKYGNSPYHVIEEGQVFTLELHVFVENHGFCSVEEDVIVTKTGCEFLSKRQEDMILLKL
ncbi:MAG: aminopeptidase P family protein [Candidatus Heimdallarchaeota archaeon]|nr:aminopeptidase P family protein [Candidatus Heimdallarchaeota archaeon]MCK4878150.1 aminopeptidase P family protein [Candidatus Heimdallarchaeota archaeon]